MKRDRAYQLRNLILKASASLPDEDAVEAAELFAAYQTDHEYKRDDRFRYGEKLYRALQDHTSAKQWKPDETPALYAEVSAPCDGETPDRPIAYSGSMALESCKYYSQNGVVYRCTRDTVHPVYNDLADLVGIYVEVVV